MPLISSSNYLRPAHLFNGHLQTIIPGIFRKPIPLPFERERINTPDGDFLDLDWLRSNQPRLVIISHGLEGNSQRPYMTGMAEQFFRNGYDVLTWNFRGCGEEMNHTAIFYHSGATYDLHRVVQHAERSYQEIFLIGFSLGGNLTLKYLGEERKRSFKIKKAVTISVPLHLHSSSIQISKGENILYAIRFLLSLKEKIQKKAKIFPEVVQLEKLKKIKTLEDFDEHYTGPLHGFDGAKDYYEKCSSLYFLHGIQVPSLILNAQNDPFLSEQCFPTDLAQELKQVYMEFPHYGGHVGFSPRNKNEIYWSEKRAFEFVERDI
ncbi:YheT family hydrolase [Pararhodonellum marinum]|uniref:YheT family hydrolase n=1 Tax=Pararhodonellum marinum TaxID=2755358 RepID=UPI00188E492E|nr:alpha/beta fold hydrolase [Pararhodonellum marinum]